MAIEFRVEGKDKDIVADELALYVKSMFGVAPTRKKAPESNSESGVRERGVGVLEVAILVVHVAIIAHSAYKEYVQEPFDKSVSKWRELVFFAKEKQPTLIHANIGNETVLLHKSEPEKLHELTRRELDIAIVTTDDSPTSRE